MTVLSRLARLALAALLLAAWQASLEHRIEHASHKASAFCVALDAVSACAPQAGTLDSELSSGYESPRYPAGAPRVADAPPFLSQGPPIAV